MCTSTTPCQAQPNWARISLAAARRGDREAFSTLVNPHRPRLERLARRLTRSPEDAEDVCQESLLKAFTKFDQFAGQEMERDELGPWLMKITANCAIDFLRRKKASRLIPMEDGEYASENGNDRGGHWTENPETCYRRQEQLEMIAGALSQLPADLRIVCVFRNVREFSTKETAARLGISNLAVRLRLFRAHGQLRKILGRRMPRRTEASPSGAC